MEFTLSSCLNLIGGKTYNLIKDREDLYEKFYLIEDRDVLQEKMKDSGYNELKKLIKYYSESLPTEGAVLEIGPFLNPLGPDVGLKNHHWIVWEYDSSAILKILRDFSKDSTSVFQVDLNKLNSNHWMDFIDQNIKPFINKGSKKILDSVILSSVINYIDYRRVLKNIVDLIKERGVLFVANSKKGVGNFYESENIPQSIQFLEFIFSEYPGKFDILEGSTITSQYQFDFSDKPAEIRMGLVNRESSKTNLDLYEKLILQFLNEYESPYWPMWETEFFNRRQLQIDAVSYLKNPERISKWEAKKVEILEEYYKETILLIENVIDAEFNSKEHKKLKELLESSKHKYRLTIERQILLDSLSIKDKNKRRQYLKTSLFKLYSNLGHTKIFDVFSF